MAFKFSSNDDEKKSGPLLQLHKKCKYAFFTPGALSKGKRVSVYKALYTYITQRLRTDDSWSVGCHLLRCINTFPYQNVEAPSAPRWSPRSSLPLFNKNINSNFSIKNGSQCLKYYFIKHRTTYYIFSKREVIYYYIKTAGWISNGLKSQSY